MAENNKKKADSLEKNKKDISLKDNEIETSKESISEKKLAAEEKTKNKQADKEVPKDPKNILKNLLRKEKRKVY